MRCPGLSARFPAYVLNWLATQSSYYTELETPDGKSDKDWVNNIRPTLVRAGEDGLFMEFECWAEDIRRESFIVNDRELRYAGGSWGTAPDLDGATDVVRASMKIRKLLDDDQIVRFNDEVTP